MNKLGRGLQALIQPVPEDTESKSGMATVAIEAIFPNRYQPRKEFQSEKIKELAASLKENGMIQPIIVSPQQEEKYELIAGERRWRAAKLAGFTEVPVIILDVTTKERLQYAVVENVQREDLNAIDEAKAYQKLRDDFGLMQQQIADLTGKDRATISNFIRLLKLPILVQDMVLQDRLSSGHARAILQVPKEYQEKFAESIIKRSLSVRQAEAEARRISQFGWQKEKNEIENHTSKHLETNLHSIFSVKVKVAEKNDKGKITFYFNSSSEKEKLTALLVKK